jgi:class 3 adenylate cyclase
VADDLSAAQPGSPFGSARSCRLRLVRAGNLTIAAATDSLLPDLYRARFEGAPPKVQVRGGVVAIEYGPRFRPSDWGRQGAAIALNPSVRWRIEAPRGLERLRADLSAVQLLGVEVQHATREVELTLPRPAGPVLLRFTGGASDLTIRRPAGTAARVQVAGGASRLTFDDQSYKAVAGEASWKTPDFEQAADRYDIQLSRGVRDVVVDTLELQATRPSQRLLATVLFTDIVGSTQRARALGDQRWRELLDLHDQAARRRVEQQGGRVVKSTGDGVLAVFDGPGRGIRCALALWAELDDSGIQIRAGLHTGEVDLRGDDVGGIAVHIGARIMAAAGPGEVLVSRTVRDLVVGSDIALEDRGTHTLKGVGDQWQLFAAT